ncbi:hypothetical protein HDU67_002121, partial [Dinochytrium kinnereticum]
MISPHPQPHPIMKREDEAHHHHHVFGEDVPVRGVASTSAEGLMAPPRLSEVVRGEMPYLCDATFLTGRVAWNMTTPCSRARVSSWTYMEFTESLKKISPTSQQDSVQTFTSHPPPPQTTHTTHKCTCTLHPTHPLTTPTQTLLRRATLTTDLLHPLITPDPRRTDTLLPLLDSIDATWSAFQSIADSTPTVVLPMLVSVAGAVACRARRVCEGFPGDQEAGVRGFGAGEGFPVEVFEGE